MTSKVKVNTVETESGSTLTLGKSGDTVTLASGASQSGFGRTGTVDWETTPKTANFTAVSGDGFFVNTTSGAITATLPAGSAGAIVAFADYANTFDTNNLTITPDGSDKIGGQSGNAIVSTEGASVTFVYVDSTQGWKQINDATLNVTAAAFVAATGGTVTTCGNFKIHTFTGPGTFTVSCAGNSGGSDSVDYLVVAGGGGGGYDWGGGAGAGGVRFFASPDIACYPASPRIGPSAIPVSSQAYPITVGSGGAGGIEPSTTPGVRGSNSVFSTITSTGGGGGVTTYPLPAPAPGGSGGGGRVNPSVGPAGVGNTPPTSPSQGEPGAVGRSSPSNPSANGGPGGGGGFMQAGQTSSNYGPGPASGGVGGNGGGFPTTFVGSNGSPSGCEQYFGGGGGGGNHGPGPTNAGGLGGGGSGGTGSPGQGNDGTANTGGGGGGAPNCGSPTRCGGAGGSGIVIIRYKFQ